MKVDLLDTPSEDVRLELIPLIDVIFCILTFFILAAVGLTRQQAIDLDLPSAETGQPIPGQVGQGGISDRLYVSIDSLGQTYLDQQPVTLDLLYDVLLQFNQVSPNGLIVLYASRDARYEDVVTGAGCVAFRWGRPGCPGYHSPQCRRQSRRRPPSTCPRKKPQGKIPLPPHFAAIPRWLKPTF